MFSDEANLLHVQQITFWAIPDWWLSKVKRSFYTEVIINNQIEGDQTMKFWYRLPATSAVKRLILWITSFNSRIDRQI